MKFIKQSLTPAIATRGVMHYWSGSYEKSFKLLQRAHRWGPEIVRGGLFEGYLGLSIYRLGSGQEFMGHVISARDGIIENPSTDTEVKSAELALLREIEKVIANVRNL